MKATRESEDGGMLGKQIQVAVWRHSPFRYF
jgi:hypothetical protein